MSEEPEKGSGGKIAKWFLKKLFTTPAVYIGAMLGSATGIAFASKGPVSGAIGFGTLVGVTSAFTAFVIMKMIRMFYLNAQQAAEPNDSPVDSVIEDLRKSGLEADAGMLERMMEDRDAILKRCAKKEDDSDAKHTLAMVEAILAEAALQAEELQDLVRRAEDPLLNAPEEANSRIEGIRDDLKNAYQAVADSRSRIRRGERLSEVDFLADDRALTGMKLPVLTSRLNNETAISKRIEDRLHPEIESRIVEDDQAARSDDEMPGESETN